MSLLSESACRILTALLRGALLVTDAARVASVYPEQAAAVLDDLKARGLAISAGPVWLVNDRAEAAHQINMSRRSSAMAHACAVVMRVSGSVPAGV